MPDWDNGLGVAVTAAFLLAVAVVGRVVVRGSTSAYDRHVARWAARHGWAFRAGGGPPAWAYRLPHGANAGVRFQVSGERAGRRFTLAHVRHDWGDRLVGVAQTPVAQRVHLTVVVIHLAADHPPVEVAERRGWAGVAGREYGTVGHARFDELFTVHAEVPGGPSAGVPHAVAEAQVRREIPVWALHGRELVCTEHGGAPALVERPRLAEAVRRLGGHTLDEQVDRAIRVADLLGVR